MTTVHPTRCPAPVVVLLRQGGAQILTFVVAKTITISLPLT